MTVKFESEQEMRNADVPWFDTKEELVEYITALESMSHDYGTAVYAVSMATVAMFNYMARKLGITGFQAGCADLDVIRRTRHLEDGFRLIDYNRLLYPQYLNEEHFPTHEQLLMENRGHLARKARKLLKESPDAHPNVIARWEYVASLGDES